ncbi:EAL domain-containing protein [Oxalobacter vibrioformis]|uniref:EAL domain-containing protein n=1 Tax=Oxalobacter vibrioformis TaxID=933080 RepID=UPI0038CD49A8
MLKDLNTNILKQDHVFRVSQKSHNERSRDAIQSVVQLAKKIDITTILEEEETMDQLEFLRKIRCNLIQGLYPRCFPYGV